VTDNSVAECLAAWHTVTSGINGLATERTPISTAVPRLLDAVETTLGHHQPVQLYGTVEDYRGAVICGHDGDYDGDLHFEGDDGLWYCKDKPTVTVCSTCTDDSDSDLRAEWECPTYRDIRAALLGENGNGN
jgi:hypothetical protein